MTYAKQSEVKAGTVLVADGGFTCLLAGDERVVQANSVGELFVVCGGDGQGKHFLSGQLEGADAYVGFSLKTAGHENPMQGGICGCDECKSLRAAAHDAR